MIDLTKVPYYDMPDWWLEEFALTAIAVAGKTATVVAPRLSSMLTALYANCGFICNAPFTAIRSVRMETVQEYLKIYGIGCYNAKGKSMSRLAHRYLDLRTCTTDDLESVYGIGPKTSRFFVLHTRRDVRVAVLDTHILKYMSYMGFKVPKSTPSGKKYKHIEKLFIELWEFEGNGRTLAEYDAFIWNEYRRKLFATAT